MVAEANSVASYEDGGKDLIEYMVVPEANSVASNEDEEK